MAAAGGASTASASAADATGAKCQLCSHIKNAWTCKLRHASPEAQSAAVLQYNVHQLSTALRSATIAAEDESRVVVNTGLMGELCEWNATARCVVGCTSPRTSPSTRCVACLRIAMYDEIIRGIVKRVAVRAGTPTQQLGAALYSGAIQARMRAVKADPPETLRVFGDNGFLPGIAVLQAARCDQCTADIDARRQTAATHTLSPVCVLHYAYWALSQTASFNATVAGAQAASAAPLPSAAPRPSVPAVTLGAAAAVASVTSDVGGGGGGGEPNVPPPRGTKRSGAANELLPSAGVASKRARKDAELAELAKARARAQKALEEVERAQKALDEAASSDESMTEDTTRPIGAKPSSGVAPGIPSAPSRAHTVLAQVGSYVDAELRVRATAITGLSHRSSALVAPQLMLYVTGDGGVAPECVATTDIVPGAPLDVTVRWAADPAWLRGVRLFHAILTSGRVTSTQQAARVPLGGSTVMLHKLVLEPALPLLHPANGLPVATLDGLHLSTCTPGLLDAPSDVSLDAFAAAQTVAKDIRVRSVVATNEARYATAAHPREAALDLPSLISMGMTQSRPTFAVALKTTPGLVPASDACVLHQLSTVLSRHPGWDLARYDALAAHDMAHISATDAAAAVTFAAEAACLLATSVPYAEDHIAPAVNTLSDSDPSAASNEFVWPVAHGGDCEDMAIENGRWWLHAAHATEWAYVPGLRTLHAVASRYIPGVSLESVTAPSAAGGGNVAGPRGHAPLRDARRALAEDLRAVMAAQVSGGHCCQDGASAGAVASRARGVGGAAAPGPAPAALQAREVGDAFTGHMSARAFHRDQFRRMLAGADIPEANIAALAGPHDARVAEAELEVWPRHVLLEGTGQIQPVLTPMTHCEFPHEALAAAPGVGVAGPLVAQLRASLVETCPLVFDGVARSGPGLGDGFCAGLLKWYPMQGGKLGVSQFTYSFEGASDVRHTVLAAAPESVSLKPLVRISKSESDALALVAAHAMVPAPTMYAPGEAPPASVLIAGGAGARAPWTHAPAAASAPRMSVTEKCAAGAEKLRTALAGCTTAAAPGEDAGAAIVVPFYLNADDVTPKMLAQITAATRRNPSIMRVEVSETPITNMHATLTCKFVVRPSATLQAELPLWSVM